MGKRNKDKQTHVWMTPGAFVAALESLWGDKCRERFCEAFDMSPSQMYRYVTFEKEQAIPKSLAMSLVFLMSADADTRAAMEALSAYRTPIAGVKPAAFTAAPKAVKEKPEPAPSAPDAGMAFDDLPEPEEFKPEPVAEAPALSLDFDPAPEPVKAPPKPKAKPKAKKPAKAPEPVKETKSERDARKKREKRAAEKAAKLAA